MHFPRQPHPHSAPKVSLTSGVRVTRRDLRLDPIGRAQAPTKPRPDASRSRQKSEWRGPREPARYAPSNAGLAKLRSVAAQAHARSIAASCIGPCGKHLTPLAQSAAGSRLSSPTAQAPKVSCSRRRNCSLLRIAPPVGAPATVFLARAASTLGLRALPLAQPSATPNHGSGRRTTRPPRPVGWRPR